MDLNKVAQALDARLKGNAPLGGTLKFNLGDAGSLFIDGSGASNAVSTGNGPADCTISMDEDDFRDLITGELQPTAAYMQGKMKIEGDMSVALKLSSLI